MPIFAKYRWKTMDIDLLSKMVKELILDKDEVTLPGLGTFVTEIVPASFTDKGYTINPPYRRLYFRQREDPQDTSLVDFYADINKVSPSQAREILTSYLGEMKTVLQQKKTVIFPGLGKLRATRENNFFFVADEDLDIYPDGFALESISLKTHEETKEEVGAAIEGLKEIISSPATPETEAYNAPSSVEIRTPEAESPSPRLEIDPPKDTYYVPKTGTIATPFTEEPAPRLENEPPAEPKEFYATPRMRVMISQEEAARQHSMGRKVEAEEREVPSAEESPKVEAPVAEASGYATVIPQEPAAVPEEQKTEISVPRDTYSSPVVSEVEKPLDTHSEPEAAQESDPAAQTEPEPKIGKDTESEATLPKEEPSEVEAPVTEPKEESVNSPESKDEVKVEMESKDDSAAIKQKEGFLSQMNPIAKWCLIVLGALIILLILYIIIGHLAPGLIDRILYSPDDLDFIKKNKL